MVTARTNEAGRVARLRLEQIKALTKKLVEQADEMASEAERTGHWCGDLASWVETLEGMVR